MRYAKLIKNDIVNTMSGIAVSLWMQGCPHRCLGCHNPETWSYEGGNEIDRDVLVEEIIEAIAAHGVQRNFSVLGGEPLDEVNREDTMYILKKVKEKYPSIETIVWTGYTFEDVCFFDENILTHVDLIIEGEYRQEERDITLKLRGSRNQRIFKQTNKDFYRA